MVQNETPELKFFASGYCTAHARVVNPESGKGKTRFYAVWALLRHPVFGILLFDAGYNQLFDKATRSWPERIYRWATPVTVKKEDMATEILKEEGLRAEDVNYVVISHLHADHICALKDFPNARFICSREALEEAKSLKGFRAVKKGILKDLFPPDFFDRVILLEDISVAEKDPFTGLLFFPVFGLEQLQLIALPGHARGMLGFRLRTKEKNILYATDASWDKKAFLKNIKPLPIVKLFFDSWKDFNETNDKLRLYLKSNPSTEILFTHCPETLKYISNAV